MDLVSFGFPLTNERQYIIIVLLCYLIFNTKILTIKISLTLILIIHIYKLYHYYNLNKIIYKKASREKIIYNILLLFSLIIFIKNNNNYILFILLFIITGISFRNISNNLYKYNGINYDSIKYDDTLIILICIIFIILYPHYDYNYIFWMELINHIIILIGKINK